MTRYISPVISQGVNIGFAGIMIIPLVVIMCITLSRAPRLKDPARVTTTYFKALLPIAILWLVFYLIQGILSIVYSGSDLNGDGIYEAQLRLSTLTVLFSYLTDVLVIMTLVEMGNGFLFCLSQGRTGLQKSIRYVAIGSCVIFAMLAIALFGIYNAEYSRYLSDWYYSFYDDDLYITSRRMSSAFNIIMFVWALLLLVFAAVVFHKTKRNYVLKSSAVLYLVAAVLNFITHLYTLIYISIFVLSDFYVYDSYETYTALTFVDPILTVWIFVAVVSLVCAIVIRRHNGLWTTEQPWMAGQGPPALSANPNYKGPGDHWQEPSNSHVLGV